MEHASMMLFYIFLDQRSRKRQTYHLDILEFSLDSLIFSFFLLFHHLIYGQHAQFLLCVRYLGAESFFFFFTISSTLS